MELLHYAENVLLHKPANSGPSSTLPSLCERCLYTPPTTELLTCPSSLQDIGVSQVASPLPCSMWTHQKAKACIPKAVLQPIPPDGVIPGLLDAAVTHALEATDLYVGPYFFQETLCVVE